MLLLMLVTCLVTLAHCDRLEELEELLEAEYDNFTLLCSNSTHNSTDNAGFLGGFSKSPQEGEEGADRETLEKFSKAVGRVTAHRREMFDEKIEAVRKRTAQLSAKEMIKLLESTTTTPQEEEVEKIVEEAVVEAVVEPVETEEDEESSAKSSSAESDSSDSESSSEESSESSEGEESSSDDEPRPSPGDLNILRWYQHWYSGVAQQRQAIQTTEYYRYLQHYGYNH